MATRPITLRRPISLDGVVEALFTDLCREIDAGFLQAVNYGKILPRS